MIRLVVAACTALLFSLPAAGSAAPRPLSPDAVLAHEVAAPGLHSYSVPVQFEVRAHKIIGVKTHAEGMVYYRAPGRAALAITKASGILGGFFKGSYKLDIVPQGWPATYHVLSVTKTPTGGTPALVLRLTPRRGGADLSDITFTFMGAAPGSVDALWHYKDGGSIHVVLVNRRVGAYSLPASATIDVDRPGTKLNADATYGDYALNAPVSASVFTAAK